METGFLTIFKNKALGVILLSWAVAQGSKILLGVIKERKFNFYWILGTGGMPSSHSAGVTSLAVCMGKELGFASPVFAFSTIFAFITMFDAQTWRLSVGVQARLLNRIMDDLQTKKKVEEKKLKELIGHTPFQVFVGLLIGLIIPLILYR